MMSPIDTLPAMASDYPLSPAQIASFRRDGHICLRGVAAPEEVAVYSPLFAEAVAAQTAAVKPMGERDTYGKAFLQITNLWRERGPVGEAEARCRVHRRRRLAEVVS